jgi:SAM-dependent methyltransferase
MADEERILATREVAERERAFFDKVYATTRLVKVEGILSIPGIESLAGKRILICSCGSGFEQVRAARAGAEVFTFDISPVAVENARRVAEFNGFRIHAEVMDFHRLDYPDNFFDAAYGWCILHHVDCELAGKELFRCLKPGAIAAFWENSDRNPLIKWFRRKAFGAPGSYQRQRFLFFRRIGTPDEYPLTDDEIASLSAIFKGNIRILHEQFSFFRLLSFFMWRNRIFEGIMSALDDLVAKLIPSVMEYSFSQIIWLQKPSA